jgi:hypothetical protein
MLDDVAAARKCYERALIGVIDAAGAKDGERLRADF